MPLLKSMKYFVTIIFVILQLQQWIDGRDQQQVSAKIELIKELVDKINITSSDLDWKVYDLQPVVGNFKCGFETLKEDVTVMESAKSQLLNLEIETSSRLKQHSYETETHLNDLLTTIQDKKEAVNNFKGIAHPCGGPGWETVTHLDFRDPNTPCLSGTDRTGYPGKTHTCGFTFGSPLTCSTPVSFPVDKEYTSVCGRIKAYETGRHDAFEQFYNFLANTINVFYLGGVSLTHGGELGNAGGIQATHIWSFTTGECPCDGGVVSPPVVGEDYFCERGVTTSATLFNPRNPLWDGAVCKDEGNECCSRIKHPYFVKHLETPTTNNIDFRVCRTHQSANTALEIIELYAK